MHYYYHSNFYNSPSPFFHIIIKQTPIYLLNNLLKINLGLVKIKKNWRRMGHNFSKIHNNDSLDL